MILAMMRGLAVFTVFVSLSLASAQWASAHPEDEFCTPGEGGMDPALCRALATLDNPDTTASDILLREALDRSPFETAVHYIGVGFSHILPLGADHILFVLALFLSTRATGRLLWQISAFTLAHTATLGLTAAGVIAPPAHIIEPLIALTIAWAAIENLMFKEAQRWRPAMVFVFGLIHGMGFAGAFAEYGLPDFLFWPGLIGFNIGVEIGQVAVIGMALAVAIAVRSALQRAGRPDKYRQVVVWPASVAIALAGLWWAIERIFLG